MTFQRVMTCAFALTLVCGFAGCQAPDELAATEKQGAAKSGQPAKAPSGATKTGDAARQPAGKAAGKAQEKAAANAPKPQQGQPYYDVIIRGGTVFNGRGDEGFVSDVAIKGDRVAAVGDLKGVTAKKDVSAKGWVVAPGFINMLSWSTDSLIQDGRSFGELSQGVTLEVFGEGVSMGPLNERVKEYLERREGDYDYEIKWNTLGEYLDYLEKKGVACNVASFIGATTARINTIGFDDRPATAEELDQMRGLVKQAMEEGAMGVGSSLIYSPATYADTKELTELCKVAGEYGGMYISHMRSEGNQFLEAIDELITIARDAKLPAEIYHLKAAGVNNWPKMDEAIKKIEQARAEGLRITADMYTYTAGSTGLDACFPPWVHDGGREKLEERLRDPEMRKKIVADMRKETNEWENMLKLVGSPDKVLLVGFTNEKLKPLMGKTLAQVAEERGTSPEETAMDLVLEDETRVGTVYFMMSEDNVKKQIQLPWVSFGSDAASMAPFGVFTKSSTHPRAYGNFARLLGKYVRDEKVVPMREAIRRLTSLPAANLKLRGRGRLEPGYFADVVVFNPKEIQDRATFEQPHRLSLGMRHVFVNGVQVIEDRGPTGKFPGRVVRGPGWTGWKKKPAATVAPSKDGPKPAAAKAEGQPEKAKAPVKAVNKN